MNILLILAGLLIIGLLVMILHNRKSYHKELEAKISEIRKLRENMTLRSKRNQELETKVSRTSEQLSSHDEFQAALSHLIGHDLRNAMNAIMGVNRHQHDERTEAIMVCGDLAFSMIRNMLDVQRFEDRKIDLQVGHYCFREILEAAKSQVDFLFKMKNLELSIEVPPGVFVAIDRDKITRTLVNLLVNAVKYSRVGAAVKVSYCNVVNDKGETYTQVSLEDEGEGIAESRLPFLFDRHWKRDTKDVGKVASAGLGLVYCKYVLEAHGGEITASSERGKGTRFDLLIPYLETSGEPCIMETDGLSISRDQVPIADEQLEVFRQYGERLYELKVYEISKIREVIEEFEARNIKTTWTSELQMAIYQGNQQKYDELLSMIR